MLIAHPALERVPIQRSRGSAGKARIDGCLNFGHRFDTRPITPDQVPYVIAGIGVAA